MTEGLESAAVEATDTGAVAANMEAAEAPEATDAVEAEGVEGGEGEVSEAVDEGLTPEQIEQLEAMLPKYKRKVKYQDVERELTLSELEELAQKGFGADNRFQEAAKMAKDSQALQAQVENLVKALRENPHAVLSRDEFLGKDYRKHVEDYLTQELMAEMDPEKAAIDRKLKEHSEMQKKLQIIQEQQSQAQAKAMEEHWQAEYDRQFTEALDSVQFDESSRPHAITRMAQIMIEANEKNLDITAEDAAQYVKEEIEQQSAAYAKNQPVDKLRELLGDDIIKQIREADLAQIRGPVGASAKPPPAGNSRQKTTGRKRMTLEEFQKRNEDILARLG